MPGGQPPAGHGCGAHRRAVQVASFSLNFPSNFKQTCWSLRCMPGGQPPAGRGCGARRRAVQVVSCPSFILQLYIIYGLCGACREAKCWLDAAVARAVEQSRCTLVIGDGFDIKDSSFSMRAKASHQMGGHNNARCRAVLEGRRCKTRAERVWQTVD